MNQCFKLNIAIRKKLHFDRNLLKSILRLSGWMTISNIVVPLIVYLDRFLIGALVSATAITYYSTPYEVITKLLLVPSAITGVLFPAFSSNYLINPDFTKKLSLKAIKYVFIILAPIIFLIVVFAKEGMGLWLGVKFAENSSLILQLLAIGVLFNSIAYVPFTFLQGIGRPDITAKIHLIEFPIYLFAMWIAVKYKGINGAAFIFLTRMVVDALIFFLITKKMISTHFEFKFKITYIFLIVLSIASIFCVLSSDIVIKSIISPTILVTFLFISWHYFLNEEERIFLISRLKIFSA